MLHFARGGSPGDAFGRVWGARAAPNTQSPDMEFHQSRQQQTARGEWVQGQRLGGLGMFRRYNYQPLFLSAGGDYPFNTYNTTYLYESGVYPFAIITMIALADTLNLHGTVAQSAIKKLALTDGFTIHQTLSAKRLTIFALTDHVHFHEAIAQHVTASISLDEVLLVTDALISNAPLLSYVSSLFNFSTVKYRNFNYNSFANIGGVYYGMNDDGLYQLDGPDDNGTPIDASVTLGQQDFDSEMLKMLPAVYIGTKTNGDLILKITTDSGLESFYTMKAQTSGQLQTNRITPGKGLKSRYWQFEIANVNGGDLNFDSISFHAVELKRRIGGAL